MLSLGPTRKRVGFRSLRVIAGKTDPHGLVLEEELETYYETEVHHGRLYPPSTRSSRRDWSRKPHAMSGRTPTRSVDAGAGNSTHAETGNAGTSRRNRNRDHDERTPVDDEGFI
jgi:hypothetical protein